MPSSFKILRGVKISTEGELPLHLRSDFLFRDNGNSGQKDFAGDGREGPAGDGSEDPALARERAEEIIAKASSEAQEILRRAREEAEAAVREAGEKGYRDGYEKGYQKGLEEARKEGEAIRKQAQEILEQAHEIRKKTIAGMEGEIVLLAREIAEKILAAQLTIDPQVVLAIVREAVLLARGKKQVVVYASPDDLPYLKQKEEEVKQLLSPEAELYILGDPAIEKGGCRVETEDSQIEATLKERWQALWEALQA